MASRRAEDRHVSALERLLSNIVCSRSPPTSMISIREPYVDKLPDEHEEEEEHPESSISQVESVPEPPVTTPEEPPKIFPSPSLRRVLPEKIRKIEDENRIRVLPEMFRRDIDPLRIPRILRTPQQKYIDVIAELVGCKSYTSNLAEYWFLDTMANLLRRAQADMLDRPTQAVLMNWFCEWMKEMQHFDAADRKRMLARFKENMLSAATFVAQENHLPVPLQVGVWYHALENNEGAMEVPKAAQLPPVHMTFGVTTYECCLRDLITIMHYIYDLFSTDFQYELVRSVFTHGPDYRVIDASHKLHTPKRLYAALKPKPAKKAEKKDKGKGAKKKDVETEDFLALMELKAREERELEELEELDREEWNKRSHVLPLAMAVDETFLHKWWPPPPPVEPEVPLNAKGKGRRKSEAVSK